MLVVPLTLVLAACTSPSQHAPAPTTAVTKKAACKSAGEGPIAILTMTASTSPRTYVLPIEQQIETAEALTAAPSPATTSDPRVVQLTSIDRGEEVQYTRFITAGLGRSTISLTRNGLHFTAVVQVTCHPG